MAILSNSTLMVMLCILNIALEIIDHITDMISTLENYQSANQFLNLFAIGQFLSLFVHSQISSFILLSKTLIHNTSRLSYGFLWGSKLKRVVILPIFILGFGSSILKVELLLDVFQKRTINRAFKQEVIEVAEILHTVIESIPQSMLQASILFFGDDHICVNPQSNIMQFIDSFLQVMEETFMLASDVNHDRMTINFSFSDDPSLYAFKNYINETLDKCACTVSETINNGFNDYAVFVYCWWNKQSYFAIVSIMASSFSVVLMVSKYSYTHNSNLTT